jgi:hypothetical protein
MLVTRTKIAKATCSPISGPILILVDMIVHHRSLCLEARTATIAAFGETKRTREA